MKRVDEEDLSERKKIKKRSHFINELSFKYHMQNKK